MFLFIIGVIFRGLFWAMILSLLLFPILPSSNVYEKDGVILSSPFQGLMARCCSYKVKERKLLIFEKRYKTIETEGGIDFKTIKISNTDHEINLSYTTRQHNNVKINIRK